MSEKVFHPIEPLYDKNSKILILGSFPSQKSREQKFFYGHPQNRFWKVLSLVLKVDEPKTVEEKRRFLLFNNIAVWDVIASCEIMGSSDSSIKNVVPNDLKIILDNANIKRIYVRAEYPIVNDTYVNGKTAEKYYNKYLKEKLGITACCLPSTSPANAAWSVERLAEAWSVIKTGGIL